MAEPPGGAPSAAASVATAAARQSGPRLRERMLLARAALGRAAIGRRRVTLRARILAVVAAVALMPLAVVWLAGTVDLTAEIRANVARTADDAAALLAAAPGELPAARLADLAAARSVWLRVYDAPALAAEGEPDLSRLAPRFERLHDRAASAWHQASAPFAGPGGVPTLRAHDLGPRTPVGAPGTARCEVAPGSTFVACAAARRVRVAGGARVVLAQDGAPRIIRALFDLRYALLKVTLLVLGPALLLAAWLVARMVPPIEALRRQLVARLTAAPAPLDAVTNRPPAAVAARDDELGDLARAFEALMAALEAQRVAQRDLVADLAHELKNPAAAVRACAETMQRGTALDAARAARIAAALAESSRRMTTVVNGFLELARAEAGFVTEARARVDVAALARGLTAALARDPRFATVRFACRVGDGDDGDDGGGDGEGRGATGAVVEGVAARLESALRNVLDNAAAFAGEGGQVRVTVRAAGGDARADGREVCVQVDDSGPGIAPEDLPRVFDRFFTSRGEARGDGGAGGTGLGLALTRAVIEAHGGTVTAESPPGQGARVTIRLPAAPARSHDVDARATDVSPGVDGGA